MKYNTKAFKSVHSRKNMHWLFSKRKSDETCYWVEKCKWFSDIRTTIWYLM
jgi:hypothetical protein